MKLNSFVLAAAIAASVMVSPAFARDGAATAYDKWEQRLRERVNTLHFYPRAAPAGAIGDVIVSFRIGADGKPADPSIVASSGRAIFDTAAVRLVSSLGRLGPVPIAGNPVERVVIKLSYGEPHSLAASKRLKKSDAEERVANERRNRWIVTSQSRMAQRP